MEKIKWGSGCVTAEAEPREGLGYFQSTIPLNPDATTLKATGPFRSSCLDWNIYRITSHHRSPRDLMSCHAHDTLFNSVKRSIEERTGILTEGDP